MSGFFGYRPIACEHCGAKYEVVFWTRLLVSLAIVLPMFVTFFTFEGRSFSRVLLYIGIVIPVIFLLPFLMRYRSKE